MAQIKIYGIATQLNPIKEKLSAVVHSCVVEALQFPKDKRAHRFFPLDAADFYYPQGRTNRYTIIEISMFEGRSGGTGHFTAGPRDHNYRDPETQLGVSRTTRR